MDGKSENRIFYQDIMHDALKQALFRDYRLHSASNIFLIDPLEAIFIVLIMV